MQGDGYDIVDRAGERAALECGIGHRRQAVIKFHAVVELEGENHIPQDAVVDAAAGDAVIVQVKVLTIATAATDLAVNARIAPATLAVIAADTA